MSASKTHSSPRAKPRKPRLLNIVRKRQAGAVKAKGLFGGYGKRTMTAREFAGSIQELAPQARMIYRIWGRQALDPVFREELKLAREAKRPYREMWKSMLDYVKNYEEQKRANTA